MYLRLFEPLSIDSLKPAAKARLEIQKRRKDACFV